MKIVKYTRLCLSLMSYSQIHNINTTAKFICLITKVPLNSTLYVKLEEIIHEIKKQNLRNAHTRILQY